MRLRAVTLTNVRRFAGQRLHIGGIGDGITVLSEPNEFGKSTVFDALHAVFFEKHSSGNATIKSLRPHSGGAVTVAVEVETPDGVFEISKQWLARAQARVTALPEGRIVASDDAAEAWIAALMGDDMAGPAGLLWVRQGDGDLETSGGTKAEKDRREADRATRRALLGDVLGGQIDAITGGRRMEAVRARTAEAFDRLSTSRGAKSGGPWDQALKEAAALRTKTDALAEKVSALQDDLAARATAIAARDALNEAAAVAARAQAHADARVALAQAEGLAEKVAAANQSLRLADLARQQAHREVEVATERTERRQRAETASQKARAQLGDAIRAAEDSAATAQTAAAARDALEAEAGARRQTLDVARRTEAASRAGIAATRLAGRVSQAERHRTAIEAADAALAGLTVTPADIGAAEAAQAELAQLLVAAGAGAVRVTFDYDGAARALRGDAEVPDAVPLALDGATRFTLPGIGRMTVDPGAGRADTGAQDIEKARTRVASTLAACGAPDLRAARARLEARRQADAVRTQARALLDSVAPDGLQSLQAELAAQRSAATPPSETPSETPSGTVAEIEAALAGIEARLATARGTADAARTTAARAEAERAAADATVQGAERAVEADAPMAPEAIAALRETLRTAEAATIAARTLRDDLSAAAPDPDRARAVHTRTLAVVRQAEADGQRLAQELARLDGAIAANAALGAEEELTERRGEMHAAEARATRYAAEAQALRRLRDALDAARTQARETFFEPILRELAPLLRLIHPDAHLVLDEASLLPVGLARNGTEEPLDILSGGTAEQIAILTRLAFANLYARAGKVLPIILDDALVHSDDARIVSMFDALTMAAKDQQIIVLTCRQRAFKDLGGTAAQVTISPA